MKITDVKALTIEGNFDWILVRVDTDEKLSGFGECCGSTHSAEVKQFVLSLRREIIGENPMNIARLTRKMGLGSTSGYYVNAISGIEMALWDLVGKALDVPVHTLLGGSYRDEVMIYADCHAGEPITSRESYGGDYELYTPEAYAQNAKKIERMGYALLKFDLFSGFPGPGNRKIASPLSGADIRYCAKIVECVRSALKDETGLAIDLEGGYLLGDAIRLVKAFEPYNLEWVEDVVPGTNVEALAEVTRRVSVPVLSSYCQLRNMRQLARQVIVEQAARIIAIDFGNIGGLQEGRKITDLAEVYFIPAAIHNIASPIGTVAAAQACATIPNFVALEHHAVGISWWDSLVTEGPVIERGHYKTSLEPGLGIKLCEREVTRHLKEGEHFF
jgi:L-alanine-DL-glutamate epimerase-like enolase superfamily enzyme